MLRRTSSRTEPSFSDGSYSGQAFAYEGVTPAVGLLVTYGGDYFPISVVQDTTDPIANLDSYQDGVGGAQTLNVLANDTDPADGSLSISSYTNPANGTLTLIDSGTEFSYTPNTGFFGTDTFTYVATDGTRLSNTATVTIQVLLPQISFVNVGTDPVLLSDDSVSPTSNADSSHLDELQITIDPDSVFESLPYNLAGWKLNLDAVNAGGSVEFWDSLGKTTELDNTGAGDESWEFGSTVSSGSVPTDLFADVNVTGVDDLLLAWQQPSGSATNPTPLPTQSSSVAGQAAELIADTISTADTSSDNTAYSMIAGQLPHGQQAYVPLSNESQVYNSEDSEGVPTQDKNYSGAIAQDKFLLPVEVTVTPSVMYLLTHTPGVSLWGMGNRTDPISSTVTLSGSGTAFIYVEGDSVGASVIYLYQSGSMEPVDSLTVNVFSFEGPQDVPNYSTYQYGVTGLPATPGEGWSIGAGTAGAEARPAILAGQTQASASVNWGTGAATGNLAYTINANYTWSYYVNIVQIKIANPGGQASAFSISGATTQYFSDANEQLTNQAAGNSPLLQNFPYPLNVGIGSAPLSTPDARLPRSRWVQLSP